MSNSNLAPETQQTIDETYVSRNASIGVIADIHYSPSVEDELLADLEAAVTRFNEANVDRVVVLGDLIVEADTADGDRDYITTVMEAFSGLDAPVTYVPGNHDLVNLDTPTLRSVFDQQLFGRFELTPSITGIYLNSAGPEHPDARGYIPQEQLAFLDAALDDCENAVLFVHHPVHYHELRDESWFSQHPECAFAQNKFEVTDRIAERDEVLAVVNGHTHLRDHTEYCGNDHFTVNAINYEQEGNEEPNGSHALFEVSESRVVHRQFERAESHPTAERVVTFDDDATVALGGTFDPVHDGHRNLFQRAFELGDLVVGLTNDELAPKTRHEERFILPFEERKASLEAVLGNLSHQQNRDFEVRELDSPSGVVTTDAEITHLIVSPETVGRAVDLNETRVENGFDPVTIEVVEPLEAVDGEQISSTRICKGEIDPHGNLTPNAQGRQPVSDD